MEILEKTYDVDYIGKNITWYANEMTEKLSMFTPIDLLFFKYILLKFKKKIIIELEKRDRRYFLLLHFVTNKEVLEIVKKCVNNPITKFYLIWSNNRPWFDMVSAKIQNALNDFITNDSFLLKLWPKVKDEIPYKPNTPSELSFTDCYKVNHDSLTETVQKITNIKDLTFLVYWLYTLQKQLHIKNGQFLPEVIDGLQDKSMPHMTDSEIVAVVDKYKIYDNPLQGLLLNKRKIFDLGAMSIDVPIQQISYADLFISKIAELVARGIVNQNMIKYLLYLVSPVYHPILLMCLTNIQSCVFMMFSDFPEEAKQDIWNVLLHHPDRVESFGIKLQAVIDTPIMPVHFIEGMSEEGAYVRFVEEDHKSIILRNMLIKFIASLDSSKFALSYYLFSEQIFDLERNIESFQDRLFKPDKGLLLSSPFILECLHYDIWTIPIHDIFNAAVLQEMTSDSSCSRRIQNYNVTAILDQKPLFYKNQFVSLNKMTKNVFEDYPDLEYNSNFLNYMIQEKVMATGLDLREFSNPTSDIILYKLRLPKLLYTFSKLAFERKFDIGCWIERLITNKDWQTIEESKDFIKKHIECINPNFKLAERTQQLFDRIIYNS